jgi:hypothetical protein
MTTSHDLTPLLLAALGKRIDDPAAVELAQALGKKPFKNATPGNRSDIGNRKLGIEVIAEMNLATRSHFPPRKDGRKWVTWVSAAFIYPNYRGSLPAGFDWKMDDAALSERFRRRVEGAVEEVRFTLPPPAEGLRAKVSMNSESLPKHMLIGVDEEETYATIYPDSKPEHSVEDGFFASWCALNGILREDRLAAAQLDALRQRELSPLAFLTSSLDGLLWEHDVRPEHAAFCHAYMNRLMEPEKASALFDTQEIFGDNNNWRKPGDAMTQDGWENFDRIAPRYALRLEQWRKREIRSMVDRPDEA